MKKTITALLSAALILSFPAAVSAGSLGHFVESGSYSAGVFSDVLESDWFSEYVGVTYDLGFMHGKGGGVFDPDGGLTQGEAVTLAARLRSIYHNDDPGFTAAVPYYAPYVSYALDTGIISSNLAYDEPATRAQFAYLIRNALPDEAFIKMNNIPDYAICDVVPGSDYGGAVYTLYRAGILTGSDQFGTFLPASGITRAEVCVILSRIAKPGLRQNITLPESLPPETIYKRSADAVFMLETYDKTGEKIRSGSGFFISPDGLAVTNEHVITGASYAIITLHDGRKYPVLGINSISAEFDLAVMTIERDIDDWSFLPLADSDILEAGASVYALGSPLELLNSISAGVVSSANRDMDGQQFFQFTAAISFGSGGGPVLNTLGQVIGVACSSYNAGQRLNLAVPISLLREMTVGDCMPLASFLPVE